MSLLLQAATVATGAPPQVFKADVLVEGSSIAQVGLPMSIDHRDAERIDCRRFLVTPGWVNGHIHLNQVLNRGALNELSTEALLEAMHARHDGKTDDDRYWASLLSIAEALSCGTTYFSAFASSASLIGQALKDAGVRGGLTIAKKDQWWGAGFPPRQVDTRKILEGLETALTDWCDPLITLSIGAASDRSASRTLLDGLRQLAREARCRIFMHVSEGEESVRLSMQHRGVRPVAFLDTIRLLGEDFTLVHACHIDADEIRRVADAGASICHCPISNAKSAAGTMPLGELYRAGISVCLGTDSASTGNTNNVLLEGYVASLLHKAHSGQASFPNAAEVFAMLTVNGARAVGQAGRIGEIEPGMKADLVLWDLDQPAFLPYRDDPVGTLVYCASEVRASRVLVDGAWVYAGAPLKFSTALVADRLAPYR